MYRKYMPMASAITCWTLLWVLGSRHTPQDLPEPPAWDAIWRIVDCIMWPVFFVAVLFLGFCVGVEVFDQSKKLCGYLVKRCRDVQHWWWMKRAWRKPVVLKRAPYTLRRASGVTIAIPLDHDYSMYNTQVMMLVLSQIQDRIQWLLDRPYAEFSRAAAWIEIEELACLRSFINDMDPDYLREDSFCKLLAHLHKRYSKEALFNYLSPCAPTVMARAVVSVVGTYGPHCPW